MADDCCKIDTGEEEVSSILYGSTTSRLYTGHECLVKVWDTSSFDSPPLSVINVSDVLGDVGRCEVTCVREIDDALIALSIDRSVLVYARLDLSKPRFTFLNCARDEINHLAVNRKKDFLSVCDDSGEIIILDVSAGKKFKICKRHDNICSCAIFNPTRQWEMISGGLDCQLVAWDYSKGRRLSTINMNKLQESSSNMSSYSINPPMIHALCIIRNSPIVAAGLGNGCVVLVNTITMNVISFTQMHSSSVNTIEYTLLVTQQKASLEGCVCDNTLQSHQVLLSGGNDSKIIVSTLTTTAPAVSTSDRSCRQKPGGHSTPKALITGLRQTQVIKHGSKINHLCCDSALGVKCYTADLTNKITVYDIDKILLIDQ